MKKLLLILSLTLCLSSCFTANRVVVSNSVNLADYSYAAMNYVVSDNSSAAMTDLEFKVYDALSATRLQMVGEGQMASFSDARKRQLLIVRVSVSNPRIGEYPVVSIDFVDYMTGRPVASCAGSWGFGMTNERNVMVSAERAIEEMNKLFSTALDYAKISSPCFVLDEAAWSVGVQEITVPGATLDNVHRVDEGVYRCEQPDSDDFAALSRMGIEEVLSLRNYHGDRRRAQGSGLRLHRLKTRASQIDAVDIENALAIILNRRGPVVIHCWHGSDRTGAVCAAYRVVVQGWTKERAVDEMVNGGYGFHKQFDEIIEVIHGLDVAGIRRQLGL